MFMSITHQCIYATIAKPRFKPRTCKLHPYSDSFVLALFQAEAPQNGAPLSE